MKHASLRFLLPFFAASIIAGCGSSGGQGTLPPGAGNAGAQGAQSAAGSAQIAAVAVSAGTPLPSGSYYSGTVSGINPNGITANCGQSNFAQQFGCLPIVTTGATQSGTPVTGQYFQMWGDLSKLPNITATTINFSATKFPTTAPTAGPTSVPTPTAAPSVPSGSYYSGTVSAINPNGITANCGQSNFAQQFGCLPIVTTGATQSGTPVAGQFFQMWGDLSKLPNITATTINFAATKFPTTAPTAGPTSVPTPTAAPSVPSGSYYSGTVSGINPNGITANCGQSNFAQQFGCLPIVTTGATKSGTPVTGQFFQMWGDLSKLPNITATTINFAATKFPLTAPTAGPTSSPTSGPTATAAPTATAQPTATAKPTATPTPIGSNGTFMGFQNAAEYPAGFVPYSATGVFRTLISAHPTIASYSSAVVAAQFPGGQNNGVVRSTEAGRYSYGHARFFATNADPLVHVVCTLYCGAPDNGGLPAQIHIPAVARPAAGDDGHIAVVQPDGTGISFWGTTRPASDWTNGATITAASASNCGSIITALGWLPSGPGTTAAGYCELSGIVTSAELQAGQINHALFIVGECAVGAQYPTQIGANTNRCTSGVGPPLGGREWYDVPCATTQANNALKPWEKAILCALNKYGGYMGDNFGGGTNFTGGVNPQVESEEPWYDYNGAGYTSPFAPLASQGWYSIQIPNAIGSASGTRWIGADPWRPSGVDFPAHIHWLDPCSARNTC